MGDSETLTSEDALELLRRQDVLQAEAKIVLANLDIIRLLSQLGNAKQLGSSSLG